ncbi:hypothetical protein [Thermococcus sp.]|uniref:hypothetical protein n=1 Tax=Thermococcus sp. TaxID=35749 RepID=UPI00261479BC|nr:hypothetical protein [Thermococcus sp.]
MADDKNNPDHPDPISVFSFFIAVATIIATVVSEMLKDSGIQDEYVFVAVFSMFMAMSFALGHVYSSNKNKGMDKIAGAFLDAFLALSVSIVIARYLSDNPKDFISNLPRMIALFSVAFFLFIFFIYMAEESLKLKLSPKPNLTPRTWEYSAVGISIIVFVIVGLIKSGIFVHVSVLTVIIWVIAVSILLISLKVSKGCGLFVFMILVLGYFTLKSPSEVFLIPGFLLMFFMKLFLDDVLFVSSAESSKLKEAKKIKHARKDRSILFFLWRHLNMHPKKRTLRKP